MRDISRTEYTVTVGLYCRFNNITVILILWKVKVRHVHWASLYLELWDDVLLYTMIILLDLYMCTYVICFYAYYY